MNKIVYVSALYRKMWYFYLKMH